MYKIETNQTNVPLADLKLPLRTRNIASKPDVSVSSRESSVETTRPVKYDAIKHNTHLPLTARLQPGPVLLPTAYSSRLVTEDSYLPSSPPPSDEEQSSKSDVPMEDAPAAAEPSSDLASYKSASPLRRSHERDAYDHTTPIASRRSGAGRLPEQLSSPPNSQDRSSRRYEFEGQTASSAVKGRAAEAILGLMVAADHF
jgi:hypothetical protein